MDMYYQLYGKRLDCDRIYTSQRVYLNTFKHPLFKHIISDSVHFMQYFFRSYYKSWLDNSGTQKSGLFKKLDLSILMYFDTLNPNSGLILTVHPLSFEKMVKKFKLYIRIDRSGFLNRPLFCVPV